METEFVRWLKSTLPSHPQLKIGLGDDAAVLSLTDSELVVTSDLLCDGVHFDLATTTPERAGRKAMAVNLSDLAAMAAKPLAATLSLLLPQGNGEDFAKRVVQGVLDIANEFNVTVIGGDTNSWPGKFVVDITLFGRPNPYGSLLRSTAQVGDAILVTGELGGSILGHHLDFTPRVHEANRLHTKYELNSGMDITDGLLLDLSRLCEASNVGAVLQMSQIPISDAAKELSKLDSVEPLIHALSDGEDFELLFTARVDVANTLVKDHVLDVPITQVGEIVETPGLWKADDNGQLESIEPKGYQHRM